MFDKISAREISGDMQAIAGLKGYVNQWNSAKTGAQRLMGVLGLMNFINSKDNHG